MANKIAKQNYYTEKREKERDPALLILVVSCRIATVLQVFNYIISRIEDGVRHKFSCLKILIQVSVSCICFFNTFPLADFSIFSGNAFHSRTPNRENEFFSCSRLEDMTQNLLVVADLVL